MSTRQWGNHILFEPADLERMFSYEDSMSEMPSVWEELQEESLPQLDMVKDKLDQLPPREADFIELYFFQKIRQSAIAELFNVSQPTVCYRLRRGAARLKYLLELPDYDREELLSDLHSILKEQVDIDVMMGMLDKTCQSDVAKSLGVSQGFVRYRFLRTISKLEKIPEMEKHLKLFQYVFENLNMLKNTSRALWSEETIYSLA